MHSLRKQDGEAASAVVPLEVALHIILNASLGNRHFFSF